MSTQAPVPAPQSGLFGLLAERQLAQHAGPFPGSLRPWLPYSFDGPSSVAELEPPPAELRSDADDVSQPSLAPRRGQRDEVRQMAAPPPFSVATTRPFDQPSATEPRPPLRRDGTPATVRPEALPLVDPTDSPKTVASSSRTAHVPEVVERLAPGRASAPAVGAEPRVHTRDRRVTVEHAARGERPLPPSLVPSSTVRVRESTSPVRLTPRVPPVAPPFTQQRETRAEPTIEIHIGRIDVRAQTAPAARAVAEAPAAPDDRLAAYLRRRGTGARS
jgi:hypothetical protein